MLSGLKDKALRAALPLISGSAIGNLAIRKALEVLQARTGIPMQATYIPERERWQVTLGEKNAPMGVTVLVTNDVLCSLIEQLLPDVLNQRKIPLSRVIELLQPHLRCTIHSPQAPNS